MTDVEAPHEPTEQPLTNVPVQRANLKNYYLIWCCILIVKFIFLDVMYGVDWDNECDGVTGIQGYIIYSFIVLLLKMFMVMWLSHEYTAEDVNNHSLMALDWLILFILFIVNVIVLAGAEACSTSPEYVWMVIEAVLMSIFLVLTMAYFCKVTWTHSC